MTHMRARKASHKSILSEPTEYQEAKAYYDWTQLFCPRLRGLVVHIPNEGIRSAVAGHRLKTIGMASGFPDYAITVPSGRYHGLYIEMKRRTKSHTSPQQRDWIARLNAQGYYAVVTYGWDEAREVTLKYLANEC